MKTDLEIYQRASDIANELVDRSYDPVTWLGIRSLAAKLLALRNKLELSNGHDHEWASYDEIVDARRSLVVHP